MYPLFFELSLRFVPQSLRKESYDSKVTRAITPMFLTLLLYFVTHKIVGLCLNIITSQILYYYFNGQWLKPFFHTFCASPKAAILYKIKYVDYQRSILHSSSIVRNMEIGGIIRVPLTILPYFQACTKCMSRQLIDGII